MKRTCGVIHYTTLQRTERTTFESNSMLRLHANGALFGSASPRTTLRCLQATYRATIGAQLTFQSVSHTLHFRQNGSDHDTTVSFEREQSPCNNIRVETRSAHTTIMVVGVRPRILLCLNALLGFSTPSVVKANIVGRYFPEQTRISPTLYVLVELPSCCLHLAVGVLSRVI